MLTQASAGRTRLTCKIILKRIDRIYLENHSQTIFNSFSLHFPLCLLFLSHFLPPVWKDTGGRILD